ncbi:glycosyltransferase family 2 protein, partial [Archaeoglobales archaeon]
VEEGYRRYYNVLRLAESKAWSTPIFHGELAAFRKDLLEEIGGFPTDIGADDSHTATKIALIAYRAIIPENTRCHELIPKNGYIRWRIRRAQHLIQHFMKTLRLLEFTSSGIYGRILAVETFLHVLNPWLLLMVIILLLLNALVFNTLLALILTASGLILLAIKPYRTWIISQIFLIIASVRNLWTREMTWSKSAKLY